MNALDGIRILDLSRVLAGPWCTQTLADLGADVIKVERARAARRRHARLGPALPEGRDGHDTAEAAYYLGANRNKRSITCDIAQPEGQALIRELAAQGDVFVENFKVGDMARYGLDFASLHAINPRLVYCSITGFGQTGPYRERAGYDYAIQGMGGLMSVTGERDDLPAAGRRRWAWRWPTCSPACTRRSPSWPRCATPNAPARASTSTWRCSTRRSPCWPTWAPTTWCSGKVPGRAGNAHQNIVPYQVFEVAPAAQGQQHHVILAVGNDSQFAKFCEVAGRPELAATRASPEPEPRAPPRRAGAAARSHHEDAQQGRLAGRAGGRQGAGRPHQQPGRGVRRPAGQRAAWSARGSTRWPTLWLVASPLKLSATPVRTTCRRRCWASTPSRCCAKCWIAAMLTVATERKQGDLMANFVLVHGAWHGGWCWQRVTSALAAAGPPRPCGDADRRGRARPPDVAGITLETHIADVSSAIEAEELDEVVLAVHSYAGMIGTAIADRLPRPPDATSCTLMPSVPKPGESWSSTQPVATREARLAAAQASHDYSFPPPDPRSTACGRRPRMGETPADAASGPHVPGGAGLRCETRGAVPRTFVTAPARARHDRRRSARAWRTASSGTAHGKAAAARAWSN